MFLSAWCLITVALSAFAILCLCCMKLFSLFLMAFSVLVYMLQWIIEQFEREIKEIMDDMKPACVGKENKV